MEAATRASRAFFHSHSKAGNIINVHGRKVILNLGALQKLIMVTMSTVKGSGVFAIRIALFYEIQVIIKHTLVHSYINS